MRAASVSTGLLTLFCQHTSASLIIQENADPDVITDLQNFFARLVPDADDPSMSYLVHRAEGPDDMPAHIKAALTQTSLSIPITNSRVAAWHVAGDLPVRASPRTAHAPRRRAYQCVMPLNVNRP